MLRNADRSLRKSGMPCPSLCVCMLTKRTRSGQRWHSSRSLNGCKTSWGTSTSATSPSARKDSRTWPWISTTTGEGGGAFVCTLGGECFVHEISCPFFPRPVSPPPSRCSVCNMRPQSASAHPIVGVYDILARDGLSSHDDGKSRREICPSHRDTDERFFGSQCFRINDPKKSPQTACRCTCLQMLVEAQQILAPGV